MPQTHRIRDPSSTYTTAHGDAGSLTHGLRPGIELASSWILCWLLNLFNCNGNSFSFFSLTRPTKSCKIQAPEHPDQPPPPHSPTGPSQACDRAVTFALLKNHMTILFGGPRASASSGKLVKIQISGPSPTPHLVCQEVWVESEKVHF